MNGSSPAPAFKPQFAPDFLSQDATAFQQQAARGDFSALRQFLAKNRQTPDWQDRYFILDVVAPSIAPRSLDPLCAIESKAADLALMQGAHFFDLVSKARGAKTADKTTSAGEPSKPNKTTSSGALAFPENYAAATASDAAAPRKN